MNEELRAKLERQGYRLSGDHSAVKLCHWMRESMLRGRHCYKQEFYGIRSHRCLQMTPVVHDCTHNCTFCWRVRGYETEAPRWQEPERILDDCIEQQRLLLTGFNGDPRTPKEKYQESREPKHVAISLAGEPTMYPYLGDFIGLCHRKGLTTFLVTNGTFPDVLDKLDPLPSQLYVTVAAPNQELYRKVCQPSIPDGWERLLRTLELLPSLDTRTVIRHTLVKGWNMGWEDEYARLDATADVDFIEPTGFVFVGDARRRMSMDNMPSHKEVVEFGGRLASRLGLEQLREKPDSRVVLLGAGGRSTELTSAD
jgi:tRNA wybutosine-synthesizing protein 1